MIVVDTNLLIYAHNSDSSDFERSREWLEHTADHDFRRFPGLHVINPLA